MLVKVYRYRVRPEALSAYLRVQERAAALCASLGLEPTTYLRSSDDPYVWIEVHRFSDSQAADRQLADLSRHADIAHCWREFQATLDPRYPTTVEAFTEQSFVQADQARSAPEAKQGSRSVAAAASAGAPPAEKGAPVPPNETPTVLITPAPASPVLVTPPPGAREPSATPEPEAFSEDPKAGFVAGSTDDALLAEDDFDASTARGDAVSLEPPSELAADDSDESRAPSGDWLDEPPGPDEAGSSLSDAPAVGEPRTAAEAFTDVGDLPDSIAAAPETLAAADPPLPLDGRDFAEVSPAAQGPQAELPSDLPETVPAPLRCAAGLELGANPATTASSDPQPPDATTQPEPAGANAETNQPPADTVTPNGYADDGRAPERPSAPRWEFVETPLALPGPRPVVRDAPVRQPPPYETYPLELPPGMELLTAEEYELRQKRAESQRDADR